MPLIWLYAVVIFGVTGTKSDSGFVVKTALDGSYKVVVGGEVWLHSGATTVQAGAKHHSTGDDTLRLTGKPISSEGSDLLGSWGMLNYSYSVTDSPVDMCVKSYTHLPVAIFSQHFKEGLSGTSVGSEDGVVSAFPTLQTQNASVDLGYLYYGNLFAGWAGLHAGRWSPSMVLADGMMSGPLLLFDKTGHVIIISAFSQFMAASLWLNKKDKVISWGIMGDVKEIPAGFQYDTVLMYSDQGINQAMSAWGELMRKWNRRDTAARDQDLSVNYIGYYTDHGSYYYHHTEPGMNYEETLLGVYKYAAESGIPYKYLQYDDWWYYEDGVGYGATIAWEPMPSVFPHGLRYIFNKTQLPVVAHNRYWSHKVVYAKQNGGKFSFLIDGGNSIPNDQSFWDYLFSSALQWGMVVYEQDFLNYQSEKIRPLYTDLSLGQQWLQQMGEAASRYGIQLQYCMALPRHLLASLQVPAVSQVRVSGDYLSSHQQYKIGHTSMFADALGLAPFKDNFWTTGKQPGNPGNSTELNPQVQAVITLLSTGPVGVGDRIGLSNVSLIHRLISADGRLLKPSKPATPINKQILQEAFGGSLGPTGEVWTTYSDIGSWRFGIIFSFELSHDYYIGPNDAGFGSQFGASVAYKNENDIMSFSEKQTLLLQGCSYTHFCLYYTAPVYKWRSRNVTLLGELSKIVPVSPQRVSDIAVSSSDIRVTLKGSPDELVNFAVYVQTDVWWFKCVMSKYGTATLSVADRSCQ